MKVTIPENGTTKIIDNKVYAFKDGEWIETNASISNAGDIDTGLTMYDINRQLIEQLPDMTQEQLVDKYSLINSYDYEQQAEYYMLLGNELKYYTLFKVSDTRTNLESFWKEVIDCISNFVDSIKSIEKTKDNSAIEIWVKKNNKIEVMYLFNYDNGVINCER